MSHEQRSFKVARMVVRRLIIPLLADFTVAGLENTPHTGPFIVAANHKSMLDIPILMAVLPRRPSIMAKDSLYFRGSHWFWRWGDAIPVRRDGMDRKALRAAAERLQQGIPFGIFPEGTRVREGSLGTGKAGAGMIALRSQAPVLPVAFTGTANILRGHKPHLRPQVTMTVGTPIPHEEIAAAGSPQAATDLVMRRIAALLSPEARGPYSENQQDGSS